MNWYRKWAAKRRYERMCVNTYGSMEHARIHGATRTGNALRVRVSCSICEPGR